MRAFALVVCASLAISGSLPVLAQENPYGGGENSYDRFFDEMRGQRERAAREEEERAAALRRRRVNNEQGGQTRATGQQAIQGFQTRRPLR